MDFSVNINTHLVDALIQSHLQCIQANFHSMCSHDFLRYWRNALTTEPQKHRLYRGFTDVLCSAVYCQYLNDWHHRNRLHLFLKIIEYNTNGMLRKC